MPRKIAPTVDAKGLLIPEWKQAVMQKKLDVEWEAAKAQVLVLLLPLFKLLFRLFCPIITLSVSVS